MDLSEAAKFISSQICDLTKPQERPFVVGMDGPDCSGKSTLAQRLVGELKDRSTIVVVHFDDYVNHKQYRERRGQFSTEAFLFDYFDQHSLVRTVGALRSFPGRGLDVVLVEGLFLFRGDLRDLFDYRIRLEIDPALVLTRALARDVGQIGDAAWVRRHYEQQCLPAQERYMSEHAPGTCAQLILHVTQDGSFEFGK